MPLFVLTAELLCCGNGQNIELQKETHPFLLKSPPKNNKLALHSFSNARPFLFVYNHLLSSIPTPKDIRSANVNLHPADTYTIQSTFGFLSILRRQLTTHPSCFVDRVAWIGLRTNSMTITQNWLFRLLFVNNKNRLCILGNPKRRTKAKTRYRSPVPIHQNTCERVQRVAFDLVD